MRVVKVVPLMMVVVFMISLPGIIEEQRGKHLREYNAFGQVFWNCSLTDNPTPTAGLTSQFTCLLVHLVVEERQRKYGFQTICSYYVQLFWKRDSYKDFVILHLSFFFDRRKLSH